MKSAHLKKSVEEKMRNSNLLPPEHPLKVLDFGKEIQVLDQLNWRGVAFADIHVGSKYGYLPRGSRCKEGNIQMPMRYQLDMETNALADLRRIGPVDVVFLMGDLADGKQVRNAGVGLQDSDTDLHVLWAVEGITKFMNILTPKVVVSIKGTRYHGAVGIGGDLDYQITGKLQDWFPDTKFYYGNAEKVRVKLGKLIWQLAHKYPCTRNVTPPMETIFKECAADSVAKGYACPQVFGWAHKHEAIDPHRIYSESAYGFLCPCMKMNDGYVNSNPYAKSPDIGFMFLEQEDEDLHGRFYRTLRPMDY